MNDCHPPVHRSSQQTLRDIIELPDTVMNILSAEQTAGPQSSVEVLLFGGFEIRVGGRTVIDDDWRHSKATALVKLLALQPGRLLHREQVLAALWPDASAAAASNSFRQNMHRLRAGLSEAGVEASLVEGHGDLVKLTPNAWLDVEGFRKASMRARGIQQRRHLYEEALTIYRGELLPGDLYEGWTEALRRELGQMWTELLLEYSELLEVLGDDDEAEVRLRELVTADQTNEVAHRRLMRRYATSGRRALALKLYQACERALAAEVETVPTEETVRLHEQIVSDELRREPPHAPPLARTSNGEAAEAHGWSEEESELFRSLAAVAVPARDEQIATILSLLPFDRDSTFRVLELGSGEGALSYALLKTFPKASVIALDGSESMRRRSASRFSHFGNRADVAEFDLGKDDWLPLVDDVDAVVSSLVIHHLADAAKLQLFRNVHARLTEPGVLLIADIVDVQRLEQRMLFADNYDLIARDQSIERTGTDSLFSRFSHLRWNFYRYRSLPPDEHAAPLFDQLTWLQSAGFAVVDCYWFKTGFAVYGGYKTQVRQNASTISYIESLKAARASLAAVT